MARPPKNAVANRLSVEKAQQIIELRQKGMLQTQIAEELGVHQSTVSDVLSRAPTTVVDDAMSVGTIGEELESLDHVRGLALAALTPEKFARSSVQQAAMVYAILTDKKNLLEGKATVIIGHENRDKVEKLAMRLASELERRGIKPGPVIDGSFEEVSE